MLQAWHLLLGFSCFLLVTCEDPHSEGLSSTSLLDVSSLPNQESVDSTEHGSDGYPDTDFQHTLLSTPQGSGFSSQETEEISIFQSPKYFWDDEAKKTNESSEDNSRAQTDGPDTTSINGVNQEETTDSINILPKEIIETSTMLWSTDIEETTKQASPSTKVPEDTIQTTQNERIAPLPNIEERTLSNIVVTSTVHPTIKPSRKNRKHSWSKNHHVNHEQESDSRPGPPADSWGLPAGHSLAGPGYHEDESLSTHSLHTASEEGKIRFSTQQDKNHPTIAAVPSEVSMASHQVICKDWINLAGKNYVILNMSDDIDCEEFRWQRGQHLLSLLEGALAWKTDPPQRDWVIFLSKPNENDNHLLMTITDEERVVPVKDVFTALGDIKRSLAEIGIESYSSTVSCQSRPSPPRSDYGKLFIVLVIIGSICVMIIIAGLIYICWQRRLPKLKNMELHFVENGCHDNPTLDVAVDGHSEMQEKKTSLNGGNSHRADGWETLINKTSKEETDAVEEDTHL
ncbi:podocalyxin-like protein 2 [Rhinoderma darwinii]|uniref:podocalyxin-like protein 2 n=1 Tax=Rhinoderma darwinii TaxID=43563 RepID=UPI003F67C202